MVAPAAGAGVGALYMGAQGAAGLRGCLGAMGWPQPATPLGAGNSTANGTTGNTMGQRRPKALGMRPYWLRGRVNQGQPYLYWESGKGNFAGHHSEHQPAAAHKLVGPTRTHVGGKPPGSLQGCIGVMGGRQSVSNPNPNGLLASTIRACCLPHSRRP